MLPQPGENYHAGDTVTRGLAHSLLCVMASLSVSLLLQGVSTPTTYTVTAIWPGFQIGFDSGEPLASSPSAWRPCT